MRIVTWNVNSIRTRLERALAFVDRHQPDVLCLQELKSVEEQFPAAEFEAAGYQAAVYGQKTYNGVAILSRQAPDQVVRGFDDGDEEDPQARIIGARFGELDVVCVYVPNGSVVGSEKYEYKLAWLERLRRMIDARYSPGGLLAVCGDFNMAADEKDVAFPDLWEASVLFHPAMREELAKITAWGLADTFRHHHPEGGAYSWWDYRQLAFPKGDGVKIDHVLATRPLLERCTGASIDRDERKGKKPSDHAPVMAEVDV
jgi:exodeoxyribonuclease-3